MTRRTIRTTLRNVALLSLCLPALTPPALPVASVDPADAVGTSSARALISSVRCFDASVMFFKLEVGDSVSS